MRIFGLALMLAAAPWAAAQEAYALRWNPEQGETHRYNYTLKFSGERDATVTANTERQVVRRGNDGLFTVRHKTLRMLMESGGQSVEQGDQPVLEATYAPDAMLVRWAPGTQMTEQKASFAVLTQFVAPPQAVAVGEGWSVMYAAGPCGLKNPLQARYTLESIAGDNAKVKVTYSSQGTVKLSANGYWLVDKSTGVPKQLDLAVTNFGMESGLQASLSFKASQPAE